MIDIGKNKSATKHIGDKRCHWRQNISEIKDVTGDKTYRRQNVSADKKNTGNKIQSFLETINVLK
jgi:hypothetical protein